MHLSRLHPLGAMLALHALFLVTFPQFTARAWALPEDRDQPLRVKAIRIERDQATGTTTYRGDVIVTQGSLRITADEVVVNTVDEEITELVATGAPATIEELPAAGEAMVHGAGRSIRYDVAGEVLTFRGQSSIRQGESVLEADQLEYDLRAERYSARGTPASIEGDGEPVRTEIPATRLNREKDDD